MTKPNQIKDSNVRELTHLCLAALIAIVAIVVLSHGKLGSLLSDVLHHGDIPPSNNCVQVVIPLGVTEQTDPFVTDLGRTIAHELRNAPRLANAAIDRFGPTLKEGDLVKLCASIDGTRVAELNGVNLGR